MLRLVLFLLFVAVFVVVAVLLANNPAVLILDWPDHYYGQAKASVAVVLLLSFMFLFFLVMRIIGRLYRLPGRLGQSMQERRLKRAGVSLGDGLAAVRGGNTHFSASMLKDAEKMLNDAAGVKLLKADIAFAKADYGTAREFFGELADSVRFNAAGRRGLLEIAQAEGDEDATLLMAREAVSSGISAPWATGPLFQILVRRRQWADALNVLGRGARSFGRGEDPNQPVRAALLCAMARDAAEHGQPGDSARYAQQALSLDPTLTQASLLLAQAYVVEDRPRRAVPVLTAAWKARPHPDIAKLFLSLEPGEDPIRRLQRVESLIAPNPSAPQSRLALAEASLGAKLWGQARHALDPLVRGVAKPAPDVCRVVALLEEGENQDIVLANQWLMLALDGEPAEGWRCTRCDAVHHRWEPVCPACGSLGSIVWEALPDRRTTKLEAGTENALIPLESTTPGA